MGTSGVTSAMFSFDVPLSEHQNYASSFPGGAEVVLSNISEYGYDNYSRTFYISSKSPSDTVVSVKCYDRSIYTECDFPCEDTDFIDNDGNEKKMPMLTALERIANACGFFGCLMGTEILAEFELPKSMLQGRSCHDVLNSVSVLLCGYWVYQEASGGLHLIAVGGQNNFLHSVSADNHEKLQQTSLIQINSVYMTNGSDICGGDTGGTDTITIDSPAADQQIWSEVYDRTVGYTYGGYDCKNALLSAIPDFPMLVDFDGEKNPLYANYCDMRISSSGILASCGCNAVDEGEWTYKTRTKRELEKKYGEGDTWNNTEITKTGGIKYVYVNENGDKQKYGFTVKDKGVTVYDGNEISKNTAADITVSDDVSEVGYSVGGITKAILSLVWDGDVLKSYSRKITDMDGNVIHDDEEGESKDE